MFQNFIDLPVESQYLIVQVGLYLGLMSVPICANDRYCNRVSLQSFKLQLPATRKGKYITKTGLPLPTIIIMFQFALGNISAVCIRRAPSFSMRSYLQQVPKRRPQNIGGMRIIRNASIRIRSHWDCSNSLNASPRDVSGALLWFFPGSSFLLPWFRFNFL